jgi:hypothetical protein
MGFSRYVIRRWIEWERGHGRWKRKNGIRDEEVGKPEEEDDMASVIVWGEERKAL